MSIPMASKKSANDHYSDETRIALLELTYQHQQENFLRFEKRFDSIDSRFDSIESRFDSRFDSIHSRFISIESKFDSKFDSMNHRMDSHYKWLLGIIIAGHTSILAIMAHGFHWL